MATNFWLSMGYNFGCVIASDTLFDSRGGFMGHAIRVVHRVSKGRCHGNQFWTKIAITRFVCTIATRLLAMLGANKVQILPIRTLPWQPFFVFI